MGQKKIICQTCKQDMREAPRRGWRNKDCPQCGQGLPKPNINTVKHRVIEFR
jgi:tRNA(Ile2) C34 agmatinyltransferase TiaS